MIDPPGRRRPKGRFGGLRQFGGFRGVGTRDWAARVSLRGERGCAGEPVAREGRAGCQSPPNRPFGRLRAGGSITQNSLLSHDRNASRAPFSCPSPASQPVIIHPLAVSALTTAPTYESY